MRNKIIPYSPHLKEYARQLRKNSTLSEVLLWNNIKNKGDGFQFHRQVSLLNYIVDFYCHEYDEKRQGELEREGISILRFTDVDVKQNMFSVLLTLEQTLKNYQT